MALAYDNVGTGNNNSSTSISWSHTSTGSNLVGIVSIMTNNAITSPSVTWGGAATTLLKSDPSGSVFIATFGIIAPASGSQTISVSYTGTAFAEGKSVSLSGADQSAPFGTTVYTTANASAVSGSVTTGKANSIIVIASQTGSIFSSITATGTNNTMRSSTKANGQVWGSISTQTTTTTGSYTGGHSSTFFSNNWYMHATEVKEATVSFIPNPNKLPIQAINRAESY